MTPTTPRPPAFRIEPLEPRRLFSLLLENLKPPPPAGDPPQSPTLAPILDLTVGGDNAVWYTANRFGSSYPWLIRVDKKGRGVDHISGLDIEDIGPVAAGPNGDTYVNTSVEGDELREGRGHIYRIHANGIADDVYGDLNGSPVHDLAVAPDGTVFFAAGYPGLHRVTGPETTVRVASPTTQPGRMTFGPDANLWFTESESHLIARYNPATGRLIEFKIPSHATAYDLAVGPDNALWFTEPEANRIGRIDLKGHVREFDVPTENSRPTGITPGPNGTIWFTESDARQLASFRLRDSHFKEQPLPRSMRHPTFITLAPDNRLYFARDGGLTRATLTTTTPAAPNPFSGRGIPLSVAKALFGEDSFLTTPSSPVTA
jgi:streptogramin lyase